MQYRDLLASVDIALHGIRFDAANRYTTPAWPAFLPIQDMRARLATIAALARDAKPILAIDRAMIDYLAVVGDLEAWEAMFVAAKPERDFTRSVVLAPEVEAVFERFGAVSLALRTAMPPVSGDGLEATIATCRAPGDLIARADHREAVAERPTPSVYGSRPTPAAIGALGRSCLAAIATLPELDAVGEKVAAGRRQLFGLPEAILRVRDALAHNYTFAMSGYAQGSTYATSYLETARDAFAKASVPLRGSSASTISPTESYRPLTPSEAAAVVATRPPLASRMSLEGRTARYRDLLASVDIELHGIRFDGQHSSQVWPRGLTAAEMRARLTAASVLARDASPATALDTAVIAYEASVGDLRGWERLVAQQTQRAQKSVELVGDRVDAEALYERFGVGSLALRAAIPAFDGSGLEAAIAACRAPADLIARMSHAEPKAERGTPSVYGPLPAPAELVRHARACLLAIANADELDELDASATIRQWLFGSANALFEIRDSLRPGSVNWVSMYSLASTFATKSFAAWRDKQRH